MNHIILKNKKNTLMVAHRGASGLERENTLPAFAASCNRTYYGEECDIHVTSDGKYLVYHDDDTKRLCDKNIVMEESTFDELRSLKIKMPDSEKYSEVLKMPTLEEYLDIMRRYGKTAVIELKNHMDEENIGEIIKICKAEYSLEKVIFISFDFDNLVFVRKFVHRQTVQFLTAEWTEDLIERLVAHKFDLDIGHWLLTKERIDNLHKRGIKINCWTCDNPADAEKLIGLGVDYITSDILE